MRQFAIISLAKPTEESRVAEILSAHNIQIYDRYAPRAWFVRYEGTSGELTDIIWPDEDSPEEYAMPSGIVIRIPTDGFNGFASTDLWEWLGDPFDDLI